MADFYTLFTKLTNNRFSYLRIKNVSTNDTYSKITILFNVPANIYNDPEKFNDSVKAEIFDYCSKIIPETIQLQVNFDKIYLSNDVVIRLTTDYIQKNYYKALEGRYVPNNVKVLIEDELVTITIPVEDIIKSYCDTNIKDKLETYLNSQYDIKNKVVFKGIVIPREIHEQRVEKEQFIDDGIVNIKKGFRVVGPMTNSSPRYITRYKKAQVDVTICGKVVALEKKTTKTTGKIFYKFTIEDPTGKMNCLFFLRKNQKKSDFESIKIDDEIYVNGELKDDDYSASKITMFVNSVYHCVIDYESTLAKINYVKNQVIKMKVPEPQSYHDESADVEYTLLDEQPYMCPILRNNDFVVFDLESTGRDPRVAKIAEIGACRISNGIIVSTFQTLVDPECSMPLSAMEVNHINDEMLKTAPLFKYVAKPFMDFCKGAVLVGHNAVNYDMPLMKRQAEELGYEFDFKCLDTMLMYRKLEPTSKKANLAYCIEKYGIKNDQAHRALADTVATAKLFIQLANNLKMEDLFI